MQKSRLEYFALSSADFMDQFTQMRLRPPQGRATLASDAVNASARAPHTFYLRREISIALHGVQHGIKRTRTEAVAMLCQFADHPLTKDHVPGGMVKDVKTDKSRQKGLVFQRLYPENLAELRLNIKPVP